MPINCSLALCEAAQVGEPLSLLTFGEVPSASRAFRMMLEGLLTRSETTLRRVSGFVCARAFGPVRLVRRRRHRAISDADIGVARGHCG